MLKGRTEAEARAERRRWVSGGHSRSQLPGVRGACRELSSSGAVVELLMALGRTISRSRSYSRAPSALKPFNLFVELAGADRVRIFLLCAMSGAKTHDEESRWRNQLVWLLSNLARSSCSPHPKRLAAQWRFDMIDAVFGSAAYRSNGIPGIRAPGRAKAQRGVCEVSFYLSSRAFHEQWETRGSGGKSG